MKFLFLSFILFFQFSSARAAENLCSDKVSGIKEKIWGRQERPATKTGDAFTAGAIETEYLIHAAQAIRAAYVGKDRSDINVHVEALIPIAENLLQFAQKDLNSLSFWKRSKENEKILANLQKELATRILNKNVTYHWLFVTSFRVAILVDRGYSVSYIWTDWNDLRKDSSWRTYEGAAKVLTRFTTAYLAFSAFERQDLIALPALNDLGLFSINKMSSAGVAPLGHSSGKIVIDDQPMFSFSFWAHDASHLYGYQGMSLKFLNYAQRIIKSAANLPIEKRRMVEFYFFYGTHERPILLENPGISVSELSAELARPSMLLPNSLSPTFYGSSLIDAGIDINNSNLVKAWLAEGLKEYLEIHKLALED